MDFTLNEQQVALVDTLGRFASREYTFEDRQKRLKNNEGFNEKSWQSLAEIGVFALLFDEEDGGLGGNAVDVHIMMQALGPALVLEPVISTAVTAAALIRKADDAALRQQLTESIAGGESRFAFAHEEPRSRYDSKPLQTRASQGGSGVTLSGTKAHVIDAPHVTHFLVTASSGSDQNSVYVVKKDQPGVKLITYRCHDGKDAADVIFENAEAESGKALIESADKAIDIALAHTNNALVAELSGLIKTLTSTTIEYLKTRKQFGVPLSQFQALQHRMADMAVHAAQIEGISLAAALALQDDEEKGITLASGAKAFACDLATKVAQEAVQLHGGVGVTDELNVSHYFKRCMTIGMTHGDVDYHMARYSDALLNECKALSETSS